MNIIIAGGGTGGHLFPGIAIAQEFIKRDSANDVTFIGTKNGLEAMVLPKLKFKLRTTIIRGFQRKGIVERIISLCSLPIACAQACYYVKKFHADIIVGLGGYVSFPAIAAGIVMNKPTVIHEQNSVPGLSNRIMGRFAQRIFVSFKNSIKFPRQKTVFTGMPIRNEFVKEIDEKTDERVSTLREKQFPILILGGSQGSREINLAVVDALQYLTHVKEKIRFIHQSGEADSKMLEQNYKKFSYDAIVIPFIDDMFSFYRKSNLVISRAGAGTLAELALCGRAAVLVPYPFAANNHQEENARVFVENGASLMIRSPELSGRTLSSAILTLMEDKEKLLSMESRAKELAMLNSAQMIVDECFRLTTLKG
jgi:UDP-N-acetylglucosamine--N-acetylmuramyl-(pentapeptide) pyrophosphoryl-undecaprenol N-acetylglucosamine transferase